MINPARKSLTPMNIALLTSVALFLLACGMPALEFKKSTGATDVMFGLRALVVGWSGVFAAVMAWYANPFWLLGVILACFRKSMFAALAGIVAIAIATTVFSIIGRELPGDEGNVTKTTVVKLLPGCYLWIASLVLIPLAALFQKLS